jgi:signal transduction histidine kinase
LQGDKDKTATSDRSGKAQGIGFIVVIASVAAVVGITSYLLSTINSEHIVNESQNNIDRTAMIHTNDAANVLEAQAKDVRANLAIMAQSSVIRQHLVQDAPSLFTTAQGTTPDFTDSYFWLDKDGKLVWANSFTNRTIFEQYAGVDRSDRPYYTVPKETHRFFISSIVESVDGVPRFYFSYPLIANVGGSEVFDGEVLASANLQSVGQYLKNQLLAETSTTIGLVAKDGTILYSRSEEVIGLNIWGEEFQSLVPAELKPEFNSAIRDSLESTGLEQTVISYQGKSSSMTYTPITVDGNSFAVLYVVAPHTLAGETLVLLDNQRNFTLLFIAALGGVAIAASTAIYKWNRNLSSKVATRTSDLESRTKELEFSNESLRAKSEELQKALATIEDTNEDLAAANENLKVHDRLQREFVNVAAHELRTPIQPLLGAAELLGEQMKEKDKVEVSKAEIEMIIRNAKRLERLSSDILEISRIESGALKLYEENFSLSYIIADAVKDAKARTGFDEDKLKIVYTPDDIFVHADREKIVQVVANILSNAIKFTKKGAISIASRVDDSGKIAIVSIKDTGQGIDPEILPKLFGKFISRSEKGTGIGLYISKKIIEAHGGQIRGENNIDGKGATFTFTLPLGRKQEEQQRSNQENQD